MILVVLLVLLLQLITIGLCVKNTTERNQWQMKNSRLETEMVEQQTNLTRERDQYNKMELQHSQLQADYNITVNSRDNLQRRLCKLGEGILDNPYILILCLTICMLTYMFDSLIEMEIKDTSGMFLE